MIDRKIKDLYEEGLESICSFAANVKINDLKKLPFSKEAKDLIWKKFIIPFKSYIHINDLTWEDVRDNIINKVKETARKLGSDNELKERGRKALENGGYMVASIKADDLFEPMEVRIIAFLNEIIVGELEQNGIETDTAFNEYFTYMVDYMEEENKDTEKSIDYD